MNETKFNKTLIVSLIIGIAMLIIGIAMVVFGVVQNNTEKVAFKAWLDETIAANPDAFPNGKPKYSAAWYIYLLEIGGAVVFLASSGNLYYYFQNKFNLKKMNIKQMAVIAVFSALSVILYYFAKFNLPFFPSWLDIQFSDVPALLVSFMYGPVSGCILILVRFFCKLPGTSTVGVGELADVIIGVTLCVVSGLIYKKHKSLKGALVAMAIGMGSATVVAVFANWLILIPAYTTLGNLEMFMLVGAMNSYMGGVVTTENFMAYYLFVGVIPFNLFRYVLVFLITLIVYKRLHMLIDMITGNKNEEVEEEAA